MMHGPQNVKEKKMELKLVVVTDIVNNFPDLHFYLLQKVVLLFVCYSFRY